MVYSWCCVEQYAKALVDLNPSSDMLINLIASKSKKKPCMPKGSQSMFKKLFLLSSKYQVCCINPQWYTIYIWREGTYHDDDDDDDIIMLHHHNHNHHLIYHLCDEEEAPTMIDMGNHRHIPDVVFFVHDPPQLVWSKLHLASPRLTAIRQHCPTLGCKHRTQLNRKKNPNARNAFYHFRRQTSDDHRNVMKLPWTHRKKGRQRMFSHTRAHTHMQTTHENLPKHEKKSEKRRGDRMLLTMVTPRKGAADSGKSSA